MATGIATTEDNAKAIQELPVHILVRNKTKELYDKISQRNNEMRALGREPSGDLVRSQQALYDAWMPLNQRINGLTSQLVPAIRKAVQNGRISQADLQSLADAGIIPKINGVPTIPGGWGGLNGLGVLPALIVIGVALAIASLAAIPIAMMVADIKIASAKANAIAAESQATLAAQEAQWNAQIEAEKATAKAQLETAQKQADIAVAQGKPVPKDLFVAQKTFNDLAMVPVSTNQRTDGGGTESGQTVKRLGTIAVVGAVGVGLVWAASKYFKK